MTMDRERIAREVAEELGWEIHSSGQWFRDMDVLDDPTRDALIDARCRVGELENALKDIASHGEHSGVISCPQDYTFYIQPMRDKAGLALREKEPKV